MLRRTACADAGPLPCVEVARTGSAGRSRARRRSVSAACEVHDRSEPPGSPAREMPRSHGDRVSRTSGSDATDDPEQASIRCGRRARRRRSATAGRSRARTRLPSTRSAACSGQTAARFEASPQSTITSALSSGMRGSSSRRSMAVPPSNGRLATTLNASCGSAIGAHLPAAPARRESVAAAPRRAPRRSPPRDHARCDTRERAGQDPGACTEVEHEVAAPDSGSADEFRRELATAEEVLAEAATLIAVGRPRRTTMHIVRRDPTSRARR